MTSKGSLLSLNRAAGSLLSLGGRERRDLRHLAKKVHQKVEGVRGLYGKRKEGRKLHKVEEWTSRGLGNTDPGVHSEEEDHCQDLFSLDHLSSSSSSSRLSLGSVGIVSPADSPDLELMRRGIRGQVQDCLKGEQMKQNKSPSTTSHESQHPMTLYHSLSFYNQMTPINKHISPEPSPSALPTFSPSGETQVLDKSGLQSGSSSQHRTRLGLERGQLGSKHQIDLGKYWFVL